MQTIPFELVLHKFTTRQQNVYKLSSLDLLGYSSMVRQGLDMVIASNPKLGILMLDTVFPRIPGDVGNARTWPFEVAYAVVRGATPTAIVCEDQTPFVEAFIREGQQLVAQGCTGIATTCGFLAVMRPRLAAALGVPVAASALEQAGQIAAMMGPGQQIGILTISAASLTSAHLTAAGVPTGSAVQGVDGGSFAHSILENRRTLDVEAARREIVAGARQLVWDTPNVQAIILECTNMVPYAPDVAQATGLPVYSIYTYLRWFHAGLTPRPFVQTQT